MPQTQKKQQFPLILDAWLPVERRGDHVDKFLVFLFDEFTFTFFRFFFFFREQTTTIERVFLLKDGLCDTSSRDIKKKRSKKKKKK